MNQDSLDLLNVSFTRGGIFYQLQERIKIVNANDRPVVVRAILFGLLAWVPLAALAALQGLFLNDDPRRSFLLDYAAHARCLIAIPFFIFAENVIDDRYVIITSYFRNSGLITDADLDPYKDILASTQRLLFYRPVEVFLLMAAYAGSIVSVSWDLTARIVSWRTEPGTAVTLAGGWFLIVSLPLFHFLLARWVWRFLIWIRFLWKLARLKMRLVATHPDGVGGLGVLAESVNAVSPIVFALSATVASAWGKHIMYGGEQLANYKLAFAAVVVSSVVLAVSPLIVFTGRLFLLKLHGLHDYGVLANRHSQYFDDKWIRHSRENIADVLGTPDVSSLADLGSGYQTVVGIRFIPVRLRNVLAVVVSVTIPMLPLLLIEFPIDELLIKIGGALL